MKMLNNQIRSRREINFNFKFQQLARGIKSLFIFFLLIFLIGCSKTVNLSAVVYKVKENTIVLKESQNEPFTGNVLCNNDKGLLIYELVIEKGINITDNIEVNRTDLCNSEKMPYEYYWDILDDSLNVFMKDLNIPFSGRVLINSINDTIDYFSDVNMEIKYRHGKKFGNTIYFFESGKIESIICYENNEMTGESSGYYENGQLQSRTNYRNGKIVDGEVVSYFDNGKIMGEYKYKNGKLSGPCINYYKNGQINRKINYLNGKLEGDWAYWKENGDILDKGKILNGSGTIRYYYASNKLRTVYNYKNGERDGLIEEYYENGKLESVKNYNNGILDGEYYKYFENNTVEERSYYSLGEYKGKVLKYFENGQLKEEAYYKKGKLDGERLRYYSDGTLSSESNYINGVNDGWNIKYKENGDILYDLFYVNGEIELFNAPKRVNPEISNCIKHVQTKLTRLEKDYKRSSKPYSAHVRAYFQFKNISNKKIAAVKFDFCFKDAFGDELYSGSVKYNLNLKAGETNPMDHYWYWEDSYSSPYDKLWSPVESGNVTTEVLVTKIVFSDGSILE